MTKKLAILSDYGLDDAAATAHLLHERRNFEQIDIVTVAGNVSAAKSFVNAHKLLSALGGDLTNIRIVPTESIPQRSQELPEIHGGDGMGGIFPDAKSGAEVVPYEKFIDSFDEKNTTVLSLGALTVTKDILLKRKVKKLVIMAGLADAVPNFEGLEFNQALDKESCAFCYRYPHVAATLDTCRAPGFNLIDFKPAGNSAFTKIIGAAIRLAAKRHPDNCYIYDLIASLYITNPEIFTVEKRIDPCGNTVSQLKVRTDFSIAAYLKEFCR